MSLRTPILSLALSALIAFPAAPVLAQAEIIGGIVGGIVGGAIANSTRTQRVYVPRTTYSSSSPQREQNRAVQTALNYFGFDAGTADGALGPRSRNAISRYQAFMETPVTGNLTEFERRVLTTAHTRAQSGVPEVMRIMARPLGAKELLSDQWKAMAGGSTRVTGYGGMPIEVSDAIDEIADSSDPSAEQLLQRSGFVQLADINGDGNTDYILDTSFAGSSFWCNDAQCKALVFASTSDGYRRNDLLLRNPTAADLSCVGGSCTVLAAGSATTPAPQETTPEAPADTVMASTGALPSLGGSALPDFGAGGAQNALSSHCGRVSLVTNANGGFTTIDNIVDANLVLNEQFCLARTYAIEAGTKTRAGIAGVTPEQVAQICGAYSGAMSSMVSAVSLKSRDEVVKDVSAFILESGKDPAELTTIAQICLGHGYQTDDMPTALSASLLLIVLGEGGYGELVGHHLRQGIGASKRSDFAADWYAASLAASDRGDIVFAPTMTERPALIRAALGDGVKALPTEPADAGSTPVALPTFE